MAKKLDIPAATRATVYARFDCCAACGTWDADCVAHIVAEHKGGTLDQANLVRLCGWCNQKQHTAFVPFGAYATYTESRALVETRRAMWAKACGQARNGFKIKPYKPA